MTNSDRHFKLSKKELEKLLNERENAVNRDESSLQKYFEKYPFAILGSLSGHSQYNVLGNTIISQPKIKSFDGDRVPDFLVVTYNSLNLYFNFIEIEDPAKKIFSKGTQEFTTEFHRAHQQLVHWKSLKEEVVDYCGKLLGSLFYQGFRNRASQYKHYNYILLYGFSKEVDDLTSGHNGILQNYFDSSNMYHCTYSRVLKSPRYESPLFMVKRDAGSSKFKAIGFTPFKKYGADEWFDFHNIIGKQELIRNTDLLTTDEKEGLISQIDIMDNKRYEEVVKMNRDDLGVELSSLDDDFE